MRKLVLLILSAILIIASVFGSACISHEPQPDIDKKSVSIKYTDAQTIMQLLIDDNLDFGLLPEPAATTLEKVKGKNFSWQSLHAHFWS